MSPKHIRYNEAAQGTERVPSNGGAPRPYFHHSARSPSFKNGRGTSVRGSSRRILAGAGRSWHPPVHEAPATHDWGGPMNAPRGFTAAREYPLWDAIFGRRSRRVAAGGGFRSGTFSFQSMLEPQPLSRLEEAYLIAATGITGL